MRILCTNDDGIHAPGLKIVEQIARALSHAVWVVAPELDQSGASQSLARNDPCRLRQIWPRHVAVVEVTRKGKGNLGFLKVEKRREGRGNPYFWIGFERAAVFDTPAEGTDLAALAAGYVSVTPLRLDRTDDAFSAALTATLK